MAFPPLSLLPAWLRKGYVASHCVRVCVCVLQTFPETAISSYAASLKEKASLIPALYRVIRENYSDVRLELFFALFALYERKPEATDGFLKKCIGFLFAGCVSLSPEWHQLQLSRQKFPFQSTLDLRVWSSERAPDDNVSPASNSTPSAQTHTQAQADTALLAPFHHKKDDLILTVLFF